MIQTQTLNHIERHGIQKESVFRIRASAKAFSILSSNLYTDKILAIVREVSVNAQDSHIAAHNPQPFIIHLPNTLEPYFSVKDFGTGLSEEMMETVYTTYFESTKTESNDFTGCLGLGSKTPMSYTDSFTVISRFDGEKITYNIFLNQNGIPSIARLHQEPTTEHNGLEVVVPVKEKDFNEFRLKAQQIFKRFQNPPEIIGNSNYKLEPVTHSMHGEGWALRSPVDEYNQGSAVAVMGSVGYRIVLSDSTLTDIQERALDLPVDLFFKIGEVDVNAGREGLSFDAPTVANIKNRLDSMVIELRDLVSKKFDACTTLWEARCLHYDIFTGEYKPLSSIIKEKNCIIWNGHELSHHEIHHHSAVNIRLFQNEKHVESTYRRRCNRKATIRDGKSVDGIAPRTNTIFVLDDDSTKLYRRCSYYCERNSETNLYLLTPSVVIPDPNSSVVPLILCSRLVVQST